MKVLSAASMVYDLVDLGIQNRDWSKIRKAEEMARESDVFMFFGEGEIYVEDDVFYIPEEMI